MKNDDKISRRKFIRNSAGAAALLSVPTIIPASAFGSNDKIQVAVLGVNGRGKSHIKGFQALENAQVVYLCDPDKRVLAERSADFQKEYSANVQVEQDLRKIFDNKKIDVVSIATPNHWHALAAIWAMKAGKDVYVEKPGSHNLFEGRMLIEAAKKYKRVFQHGVQLRSSVAIQEAIKHLRDGVIGDVYMARGLVFKWRPDIGDLGTEPVPEGLDYDLWTGPAEMRPFSRNYVHYNWHWHWNYGNGDVGNQGIHETDLCMWGLDVGLPERITSMGGKFLWDDSKETPEVLTSNYHYPSQKKMIEFEVRPWVTNGEDETGIGNIFYGSEGYMVVQGYNKYATFLGRKKTPGPAGKEGGDHYKNFIDAVASKDPSLCNGPVETAHLSSGLAHLGNIAYRVGRVLNFDPKTERFIGDPEADQLLTRTYRDSFAVPAQV